MLWHVFNPPKADYELTCTHRLKDSSMQKVCTKSGQNCGCKQTNRIKEKLTEPRASTMAQQLSIIMCHECENDFEVSEEWSDWFK